MPEIKQKEHKGKEQWSSRIGFLLAAVGFSVGLGNIWRFPYVTGENGGGAFLLIYLACVIIIGLPLLTSELALGRQGRGSAAGSIRNVALSVGRSPNWGAVGGLAVFCVFIIMTYYTVIAGWTFDYFFMSARGVFQGVTGEQSGNIFAGLVGDPWRLLFWHTLVIVLVVLAALAIFTFRGIFSALTTAYEVETKLPDSELKINKETLQNWFLRILQAHLRELFLMMNCKKLPVHS